MYLSIDFEDFYHDLKRSLGLWETGNLKVDELWNKYNIINNFVKTNGKGKGKNLTFFCTALIAKYEPELIKQIVADGHEIACHYFFHDSMINQESQIVEKMILKSIEVLENVSGKKIYGFRAPNFSIRKSDPRQYKIIEKYFLYDSSFYCESISELKDFYIKMELDRLNLIPIFSKKIFGKSLRLGGSYLKMFPLTYSKYMYKQSSKNGFEPHIYLHPYEFGNSFGFRVKRFELKNLGYFKSLYWSLRQSQWLNFYNNKLEFKISYLLQNDQLSGRLCDQFLN